MLRINTNIYSRTHYDEDGSQFVSGMPKMFFRSKDTIVWQLYSETPGLDENETPDEVWTKFTGYEGMTGINAYLTADNNYTHRMKGTLDNAVPTTPTVITATVPGAGLNLIPEYGTVNLFDREGHYDTIEYDGREINGNTVVFQVDGTPTLSRSYDSGWVMDVGEEVYMQATLDYQRSDVSTGLFVFEITAYSEKLRQSIVYSDVESVPIRGLELAIFQVADSRKQDIDRYVVTTFKIMSGIAETDLDPLLPPEHQNDAILMLETLLASGFQIQYSTDGETWTDTQHEPEDFSDSSSSSIFYPYEYFRFRSAAVGGTWSQPIRIRNGRDGADGVKGNTINQGTAITGTSTTPMAYNTGIAMSYMNDLYINPQTQYVYQCVQDGDEETALWVYSFCLKGEAFDAIDNETITQNSDSELQSIGFRESNRAVAQRVWVGTLDEYTAQGKANSPDICIITDDDSNSDSGFSPEWIIDEINGKQDTAREVISSTSSSLSVVPNKVYGWTPSSSGVISFDHTNYSGKSVEIPVFLTLTGGKTVTGSTSASTAVTIEGVPESGEWRLVWDGTTAVFRKSQAQVVIDSQLSDSSLNPVQNRVVTKALEEKQDILTTVVTSTSNSLAVMQGNAYTWNPSSNGTISFNHTGLAGKSSIIPVKLTLGSGKTITGSTSSSTAVTVEGVPKSGYWELIWDGDAAVFRNSAASEEESDSVSAVSSYLYIAYATDSEGTGFSLSPSVSRKFMATLITHTDLGTPTSSDFSGSVWVKFIGDNGTNGTSSYLYIAYATNSSGSGWTLTPDTSHPYLATKISSTQLTPTSTDFSGATWVKYIGSDGSAGTRGSRINYGTAITGTSTTPTAYATGINDSLVNDLYLNTDLGNIYQCTTAGNASTAKWVFACTMRAPEESDSESYVQGVQLNGVDLVPSGGIVDVTALPITNSNPSTLDQNVALYIGDDSNSDSLKKGHLYEKETIYDDSTVVVSWNGTLKTLSKGSGNTWGDGDYDLIYSDGSWQFSAMGSTFYSPSVANTIMPWDPSVSGQAWTYTLGTAVITIECGASYSLNDITPADNVQLNGKDLVSVNNKVNVTALAIATSMPTADKDAQPFILFLGTTTANHTKGHLYEKTLTVDDSAVTMTVNGNTRTLTKSGSKWEYNDYELKYDSTYGAWTYNTSMSGDIIVMSPSCAATDMPWDFSGMTWTEYQSNGPMGYEPSGNSYTATISPNSSSYSWTDLGSILGS